MEPDCIPIPFQIRCAARFPPAGFGRPGRIIAGRSRALLALTQGGREQCDATRSEPAATEARLPPQYRTYRLADYIVNEERTLLAACRAQDWQEMFSMVCDKFEVIASLMRNFHEDEVVTGFFLHQIATE